MLTNLNKSQDKKEEHQPPLTDTGKRKKECKTA